VEAVISPFFSVVLSVCETSEVAEARRRGADCARLAGFDETAAGKLAVIVTEAAKNVVRHSEGGEMILQVLRDGSRWGVEVLALDRGPGIENVRKSLEDGYSTSGTPGTGLGAIRRFSSVFDIWSDRGCGTVLLARLWAGPSVPGPQRMEVCGVSVPKKGELVCGDGWAAEVGQGCSALMVADGLGHGEEAANAARNAVRVFGSDTAGSPVPVMQRLHGALRSTRGAAAAVAHVVPSKGVVRFAGVGNIAGRTVADGIERQTVSNHGIVGHNMPRVNEFAYPWPAAAVMILHSDGLTSHWNLTRYPALTSRHPALIASVLYRDFSRGRDDVTVVVAR
jgi:anti-sigma regulatory factor (Ser/Thr protein kinase)